MPLKNPTPGYRLGPVAAVPYGGSCGTGQADSSGVSLGQTPPPLSPAKRVKELEEELAAARKELVGFRKRERQETIARIDRYLTALSGGSLRVLTCEGQRLFRDALLDYRLQLKGEL